MEVTFFSCFSASLGLSQNVGSCVFCSSSSMRSSLASTSKMPPQRMFSFYQSIYLVNCCHTCLFFIQDKGFILRYFDYAQQPYFDYAQQPSPLLKFSCKDSTKSLQKKESTQYNVHFFLLGKCKRD